MRVLFVVGGLQETLTVFRLAERMAEGSWQVVFLFTSDGRRHSVDPELMGALRFAEGLYVLRDDSSWMEGLGSLAERVEVIDYDGWVGLLETCDRVVSWT